MHFVDAKGILTTSGGCCGMNLYRGCTLREGSREYFYAALDKHLPGMKERYIERYGNAYELPSPRAKELMELFRGVCEEHGILCEPEDCFCFMQELPERFPQISFFDS